MTLRLADKWRNPASDHARKWRRCHINIEIVNEHLHNVDERILDAGILLDIPIS